MDPFLPRRRLAADPLAKGGIGGSKRYLVSAAHSSGSIAGAESPERFTKWNHVLAELPMIEASNMRPLATDAAKIYAICRWNAFTPRSANDCLIAAYAIHASMPLLHADRDFIGIAKHEPRLRLVPPRQGQQ